jgi:tetratricopeptide (TPR) repeat protein
VAMWRRLGDNASLARAFRMLGNFELEHGDLPAARESLRQGIRAAEEAVDRRAEANVLLALADLEAYEQHFERAIKLHDAALSLLSEVGDDRAALLIGEHRACALRAMGRLDEAAHGFNDLLPRAVHIYNVTALPSLAEDYGAMLAELGEHSQAVRLLGAADAMRTRNATPRPAIQHAEIAEPFAKVRAALAQEAWDREYQTGHNMTVEDALTQAHHANSNFATS